MNGTCAISSWSGGKDSCLACYKAIRDGYKIKHLLNLISREYKRCCFHGIEANLLKLQAEAIGIPLIQKEVAADMKMYEQEFKEAVSNIKKDDPTIKNMVFGDIYLEEHENWVNRVCSDLKITALEPLWMQSPLSLAQEFIKCGFKTIIVSCQADKFGKEFVGKFLDEGLLQEIKKRGICPCGENGEFHTFVVDGPIFKKRIEILESEAVLKEGFWKYWFLDIKRYTQKTKTE